jgi:hypothetical protein
MVTSCSRSSLSVIDLKFKKKSFEKGAIKLCEVANMKLNKRKGRFVKHVHNIFTKKHYCKQ